MLVAMHLAPRDDDYWCYDSFRNRYYRCGYSAWNSWVRWVVLGVVIVGFFLLFVLCSCLTARRRRKAGRLPFYGTGWAARPGNYNAQPYYAQQPAPPYSSAPPPNTNDGYYSNGANQGYYQQQNGVELQQPQPTYGGNYQPPPGPPPTKGDGVVR